jgi:hypothetical protein
LHREMDALVDLAAAADADCVGSAADVEEHDEPIVFASRGGPTACRPMSAAAAPGRPSSSRVQAAARPATAAARGCNRHAAMDAHQRDAVPGGEAGCSQPDQASVTQLQRLLASGQRRLRALRAVHVAECSRRAQMQGLLVDTLQQLRRQQVAQACSMQQQQQQQQLSDLKETWPQAGVRHVGLNPCSKPRPCSARSPSSSGRVCPSELLQRPVTAAPGSRRPGTPAATTLNTGAGGGVSSGCSGDATAVGLAAQEQLVLALLGHCFPDLEDTHGDNGGASVGASEAAQHAPAGMDIAGSPNAAAGSGRSRAGISELCDGRNSQEDSSSRRPLANCSGGKTSGGDGNGRNGCGGDSAERVDSPDVGRSSPSRVPPPSSVPAAATPYSSPAFPRRWPLGGYPQSGHRHHAGSVGSRQQATALVLQKHPPHQRPRQRPTGAGSDPAAQLESFGSPQLRPTTATACSSIGGHRCDGGGGTACGGAKVVDVNALMVGFLGGK